MMSNSEAKRHEQKRVTITAKRQFTIPQRFYTELGFEREAVCTMGEGLLIIQPIKSVTTNEYAEQILEELISEGLSGKELLEEFKARQELVQSPIEIMLETAKNAAHGNDKVEDRT